MKAPEADGFNDKDSAFQPRFSSPLTRWLLIAWVGLFALLMIRPIAGYLDYFAERDARYRWALAGLLVGLALASWLYARLRVRTLWRHEPLLLSTLGLVLLLVYVPWGLCVVVLLGVSAFVAGRALMSRAGIEFDSVSAELAVCLGAGFGLLIVLLIPLGLAGLYGPVLFAVLLIAPVLVFHRRLGELWGCWTRLNQAWADMPESRSALVGIAVVFIGVFELILLLASVTPTITKDAISYHVPSAQHYLLSGRLEPLPGFDLNFIRGDVFSLGHATSYSYYPQSFEELLTVTLGLGGWPAMQLTGPLFYLLALFAASAIGGAVGLTRFERVVGLVGAISLPFAHWSGSTIKNDLATAAFQLLALYCVLQARERKPTAWLILASSFLGLSFGVKHIALFGGIPIGLLIAYELWNRRPRWKWIALAVVVFAVCGTFWHARAYYMKGSPIFPANSRVAVSQLRATDRSKPSRSEVYFTYLWIAHFEGGKVIELPMPNPCGLFLAFLAIAWPLSRRRPSSATWALVLYFALYYVYWIWVWGVLRYGIAPFFVLTMLTGGRAAALWAKSGRSQRLTLSTGMTLGLLAALPPMLICEINPPQMRYLAGMVDRDAYLREANRYYPSIRELALLMKPEETAISVGNCAVAYLGDPVRIHCMEITSQRGLQVTIDVLLEHKPDYLIVSERTAEGRLADTIAQLGLQRVYTDPAYRIYATSDNGAPLRLE